MKKVMVLGASGFLGRSLVPWLSRLGYVIVCVGRNEASDVKLDLQDTSAISKALIKQKPDVLINLIGATDVDQCEKNIRYAYTANVSIPVNLAEAVRRSKDLKIHVIHISTDQLYEGIGLKNENQINPVNVYGLSKYAGELAIETSDCTILRTNFIGRSFAVGRQSFTDWLADALLNKKSILLFDDIIFNALHTSTLCDVIHKIIHTGTVGKFNVGSRGAISKANFGIAFAQLLGLSLSNVKIGTSAAYKSIARRPFDMSMDVTRIENALRITLPSIQTEIAKAAKEYRNA